MIYFPNEMTDLEKTVTFLLLKSPFITFVFLICYYLIKMDQRGRKVLKDRERESLQKKDANLEKTDSIIIRRTNSPKPPQSPNKEDVFDKLKKLNELKILGIISEDEYETQRKKFLDQM